MSVYLVVDELMVSTVKNWFFSKANWLSLEQGDEWTSQGASCYLELIIISTAMATT